MEIILEFIVVTVGVSAVAVLIPFSRFASSSNELESLKGKTCCRQVKFYSGVYALARAMVLPFKDSLARPLEPRCATPSATKLPDTPRWSEARPR